MPTRRSMIALLSAVLLATLAMTAIGTPAQASSFRQIPNYGNGKCIDVATEDWSTVQLWHCSGGPEQQWAETWLSGGDGLNLMLVDKMTGTCLGVRDDSTEVGAPVQAVGCVSASTVWHNDYASNEHADGWHQQLRNVNSGLCLDLYFNRSADGTIIQQWWCSNQLTSYNPAQLWML